MKYSLSIDIFKYAQNLQGSMPDFDWLKFGKHLKRFINLDHFVDLNSHILAQFDVKNYLGSGSYGDAWELDNNQVLKIFFSANEFKKQQVSYNLNFSAGGNSGIPMIYQLGQFNSYPPAFFVVMEKVQNMNQKLNKLESFQIPESLVPSYLLNTYHDFIDDQQLHLFNKVYVEYVISNFIEFLEDKFSNLLFLDPQPNLADQNVRRSFANLAVQAYLNNNSIKIFNLLAEMLALDHDWYISLAQALFENFFLNRFDTHIYNFGFRNNKKDVVFFDS